jgi:hypothetical protein
MALNDRLFQEVRNVLPGVIDEVVAQELWSTLNDLCRDAYVWRETVSIPLEAGKVQYSVDVPGAVIVQVFSISHDTMDVTNVVFEFNTVLINSDTPDSGDVTAGPMYLVAALAPALSPSATVEEWIPIDLWSTLHQVLVAGTKARLFGHAAKPYANLVLAQFHGREYKGLKAVERQRAATGNTVGAQRWRMPQFYIPSRRK